MCGWVRSGEGAADGAVAPRTCPAWQSWSEGDRHWSGSSVAVIGSPESAMRLYPRAPGATHLRGRAKSSGPIRSSARARRQQVRLDGEVVADDRLIEGDHLEPCLRQRVVHLRRLAGVEVADRAHVALGAAQPQREPARRRARARPRAGAAPTRTRCRPAGRDRARRADMSSRLGLRPWRDPT